MKNKMFLLLPLTLLAAFPIPLSAQMFGKGSDTDQGKTISIGLKGGVNWSNVYDTKGEEFEADLKNGFVGGVFLTLPLITFIGFQPEILFSQKGYRGSGSILGSDYSFSRTTNYIDVPLLLAIRTCEYFTLLAGPQYSFLVSQNYTYNSDLINISEDEQFENENIRKNTLCLTGGFDVNIKHIVFGARGGWDILSNKGDGTSTTPRYKNMWYQATIGYRF